ncbi:ArnT family glycosyltransferase [Dictyobacter kobayashii]|uniref:ArnT family glycosyltransferase n=1 Tax=Dictyobacter kobayashii TaxID=2014872 RepID=UPI001386D3DC|nr:glycosyltransferase family 39 protein [Dictyobacter kobayashii]
MSSKSVVVIVSSKRLLAAIVVFVCALLVRLLYILTVGLHYKPIFDAGIYDDIARNLLSKGCYCVHGYHSTVSRAPLWPWILALVYYVSDKQVLFAQLFYALLGGGTCLVIYFLAASLFTKITALITGLMAATYTGLFLYDGWLYSEALYTFCLTGFVYTLFRLQRFCLTRDLETARKRAVFSRIMALNRWSLCSGLLLAAAMLTRPNGVILLVVICAWAFILCVARILKRERRGILWQQVIIVCCIAVLLVVPWTYRNYRLTQQFVFVATGLGEVLTGVYNDNVLQPPQGFWSPPKGTKIHDEVSYTLADDKQSTSQALAWIASHPDKMPLLLARHFENMWQPYTYSHGLPMEEFPQRLSAKILFILIPLQTIPIFALAMLGCIITWRGYRKELLIVYLVILSTIGQNVIFYGDMRFRASIEPLLVLFAGVAVWRIGLMCINAGKLRREKRGLLLDQA